MKGLDTPTSNVQQVQDFDNSRLTNLQMDAVRVLNDAGWKARHISTVLKIPPMKIEYALKVIRGEENKPQPSKDYWEGKVPSIRYSRKDDTEGEL